MNRFRRSTLDARRSTLNAQRSTLDAIAENDESTLYSSPRLIRVHALFASTSCSSPHLVRVHALFESTPCSSPCLIRVHAVFESTLIAVHAYSHFFKSTLFLRCCVRRVATWSLGFSELGGLGGLCPPQEMPGSGERPPPRKISYGRTRWCHRFVFHRWWH